jgi:hypothetical protein
VQALGCVFLRAELIPRHSQFVRDESKSEAIVPHQWRFVQWAGQSKDVHRILEF